MHVCVHECMCVYGVGDGQEDMFSWVFLVLLLMRWVG